MEKANNESFKSELTGIIMLLIAALMWGSTFVAQDIAAETMPAFTFLMCRSWVAFVLLIPLGRFLAKKNIGQGNWNVTRKEKIMAGLICGSFMFFASFAQQYGIAYTTTAKSSFITALYCVIVPIIYAVAKKGLPWKLWVSMILSVTGLYFLCITGKLVLGFGDSLTLLCAILFSGQILFLNVYAWRIGGIRLTTYEIFVTAVFSTICAFIIEKPDINVIYQALPSILYAAVFSSIGGYTLQALAQTRVNPAIASIVMSLESVFGALAGWLVQGQLLSSRELFGCALMFTAIILAELPIPSKAAKNT